MKLTVSVSTGYVGSLRKETLEVDDNITEEEAEELAKDWLWGEINFNWYLENKEE